MGQAIQFAEKIHSLEQEEEENGKECVCMRILACV